jgi:hypothetical protein
VGRVVLEREVQERGFWAPMTALSEGRRGLWSVYAAVKDEASGTLTVKPRPVEVLHVEAGRAFVRGGARQGDRIITSGINRIAPGQSVRITEPAQVQL